MLVKIYLVANSKKWLDHTAVIKTLISSWTHWNSQISWESASNVFKKFFPDLEYLNMYIYNNNNTQNLSPKILGSAMDTQHIN